MADLSINRSSNVPVNPEYSQPALTPEKPPLAATDPILSLFQNTVSVPALPQSNHRLHPVSSPATQKITYVNVAVQAQKAEERSIRTSIQNLKPLQKAQASPTLNAIYQQIAADRDEQDRQLAEWAR